jgi:hypothetical protein
VWHRVTRNITSRRITKTARRTGHRIKRYNGMSAQNDVASNFDVVIPFIAPIYDALYDEFECV